MSTSLLGRLSRITMLEYTFIVGLFLITVNVHLVQMSLLPTMGRQAWHRQIPGQNGELMRVHGRCGGPHFYGFGVCADLSPRNSLVRSCTRVGTIELLAGVLSQRFKNSIRKNLQHRREAYDVNRIIGTITLRHLSGTTILTGRRCALLALHLQFGACRHPHRG